MGSPTEGLNKARLFDREMSAVTYNLKEQRVLEKSLQTLKLEQGYALKLLQLDNRIIKVQYKKLKEKVSRIKSHLPPEEISKFRELDAKGKLKPSHGGVNIGSAVKIAAAARRLNLGGGGSLPGRRGIKSALPRIRVQETESNGHDNKPAIQEKLKRSSSVTGVFIDAPEPRTNKRPGSASVVLSNSKSRIFSAKTDTNKEDNELLTVAEANKSFANGKSDDKNNETDDSEDLTSKDEQDGQQGALSNEHSAPHANAKTAWGRRAVSAHPRSHSTFSSHNTAEKDARVSHSALPSARHDRMRRMSFMSNDSIDSNLGENAFEERRQELLEEENLRAQMLDQRTKHFIKDVEEYLEQHPPLQASHVAFENTPRIPRKDSLNRPMTADPSYINGSRRPIRFQRRYDRPNEMEDTPTYFPEDQYRSRLMGLWKDMNKCRYLRVSDDKIDLSGVNTLVKDQMKLFEALRTGERYPLEGAWET